MTAQYCKVLLKDNDLELVWPIRLKWSEIGEAALKKSITSIGYLSATKDDAQYLESHINSKVQSLFDRGHVSIQQPVREMTLAEQYGPRDYNKLPSDAKRKILQEAPRKHWASTMTQEEAEWCYEQIEAKIQQMGASCVDNVRAARIWISSQRRRYNKQRAIGCCGYADWIATRYNAQKGRSDIYLLGFNYGH